MSASPSLLLIEFESMLRESVRRAPTALRNLNQESGGFSSTTPGNGSPGGGKGARSTVAVPVPAGESWRSPQTDRRRLDDDARARFDALRFDGSVDHVPITSVERQSLGIGGRDVALGRLDALTSSAHRALGLLGDAYRMLGGPSVRHATPPVDRAIAVTYATVVALRARAADLSAVSDLIVASDRPVGDVFAICERWGYEPKSPAQPKRRDDMLAVDLTETLCTSHLRIGVRRNRDRGELCDWCYRHGPLLVPSWSAPPRKLVQLREDNGKVFAHQVEPFLKAERARLNKKSR